MTPMMTPGRHDAVAAFAAWGTGFLAVAGTVAGVVLNGESGIGLVARALLFGAAVACALICVVIKVEREGRG